LKTYKKRRIYLLYTGENKLPAMRWWWCFLFCSRPTR